MTEKLHALVSHGSLNSRFKDVYDLTILFPNSFVEFWKVLDKTNLRRSQGAVEASVGEIPSFEVLEKRLAILLRVIS